MADISKCDGKIIMGDKSQECPHKEHCYRYTAPSDDIYQSWITIFDKNLIMGEKSNKSYCEFFMDNS